MYVWRSLAHSRFDSSCGVPFSLFGDAGFVSTGSFLFLVSFSGGFFCIDLVITLWISCFISATLVHLFFVARTEFVEFDVVGFVCVGRVVGTGFHVLFRGLFSLVFFVLRWFRNLVSS